MFLGKKWDDKTCESRQNRLSNTLLVPGLGMLVGDILSDDGITCAILQTGERRIGERTADENRREDQRGSGALVGHTSTDPTEASTHCHCGVIKHANRGKKFRQND